VRNPKTKGPFGRRLPEAETMQLKGPLFPAFSPCEGEKEKNAPANEVYSLVNASDPRGFSLSLSKKQEERILKRLTVETRTRYESGPRIQRGGSVFHVVCKI
jgi:hypothetical protein